MKKIKLAIGIHNHKPVGNFDFVFEEAYQKAYLPFLGLLEKHPKIKIAQHYTGILFEWILDHYPEFIERLRLLVQQGQVEMMTGGYYEPILVNIPDRDKYGQIKKLTAYVKEHTGYEPTGLWLAERIWEPQLPKHLVAADIKYTIVDDSHFKSAGLSEQELLGYYLTEETGHTINIFPISEKLRYTIPFQEPEATIDYLRSIATEDGENLVVFADDGEKFGIWPGTYHHCYENNWVDRFFSTLESNLDWIELVHFSQVLTKLKPRGRVYLPTASYREMMEWALPTSAIHSYEELEQHLKNCNLFDKYKVFVRGGFWRNFLAKYPESNNMHKKALFVSNKIAALEEKTHNSKLLNQAKDHLWAGQCNCPYWHGIFGGLYLNNIRYAVYKNMIQAEVLLDKLAKGKKQSWIDLKSFDFDADGCNELLVETPSLNLYFSPQNGGTLFELDYKPRTINLLDTMTRREEAYHRKLLSLSNAEENSSHEDEVASIHEIVTVKEKNLEKQLFYDWYRRCSLIDHFLAPDTSLKGVATSNYKETGDFIQVPYIHETKKQYDKLKIRMERKGSVLVENVQRKIHLIKNITIPANDSALKVTYRIVNLEEIPLDLWFAVEFNFSLLAGNAPDRYYYFQGHELTDKRLASSGVVNNVTSMGLKDEWLDLDIQLKFTQDTDVWRFPIETISQSEAGFERVYQNSVVFPNWKIKLAARTDQEITIIIKFN